MARALQILLHADADNDGSVAMTDHLQDVLGPALSRFGGRVSRVQVQLSSAKGAARPGVADMHCTLEARLSHEESVVVTDHARNAHQAIAGAARKLQRAVGTALAKHDPRGHREGIENVAAEALDTPPALPPEPQTP